MHVHCLVSDECSNTYETSCSDKHGGVDFASRAKMSTFVSCEPDRSVTAKGHCSLPTYTIFHYGPWKMNMAERAQGQG